MQLIIAEKPSVAKDIVAALTPQFGSFRPMQGVWESNFILVSHAVGHLVEIDSERIAPSGSPLPVLPAFAFKAIERTRGQFKVVKDLLLRHDVTHVINACDAGREGELIFRLILQAAGLQRQSKVLQRMWLQSMTADAIRQSYAAMRSDADMQPLSAAAYSRMEADWLVGINASRALSQFSHRGLSAGRVQTPTLALIVHRDSEIRNFKPSDYFEVHAKITVPSGSYIGKYQNPAPAKGVPADRLLDRAAAQTVVGQCTGHHPSAITDETKPSQQIAPKLFDLTTLQREANKRFGLSASDTLRFVQSLYEKHKALTYPRTSACTIPDDYGPTVENVMQALAQSPVFSAHAVRVLQCSWIRPGDKRIFDSSKVTDHFAIIPTGVLPRELTQPEADVFELVTRRFIAAFHPPAAYLDTVRITQVQTARFKSTGRVLVSAGWREVYGPDTGADEDETEAEQQVSLCPYIQGERSVNQGITLVALKTKPPKHYTEATLLAAMEHAGRLVEEEHLAEAMKDQGLGTPATRASIIERLIAATYARRHKTYLLATQQGDELVGLLETTGSQALTSPTMTGDWEYKLLQMEQGKYARPTFMREIADLTTEIVATITKSRPEGPAVQSLCPMCAGTLEHRGRTINCGCGWQFWMTMAGRPFTVEEFETLMTNFSIGPLSGFVGSKPGAKRFSAMVVLDEDGKPAFEFEEPPPSIQTALSCSCPKCGEAALQGGPKTVDCSKCHWKLWKSVAKKDLSDQQIHTLITQGYLPRVEGLLSSKTGKRFAAALKLVAPEFSVMFDFS